MGGDIEQLANGFAGCRAEREHRARLDGGAILHVAVAVEPFYVCAFGLAGDGHTFLPSLYSGVDGAIK